jgi:peptide/nickel transport system substrate-binding protein
MNLSRTHQAIRSIALTTLLSAASLGAIAQAEKPQYGGTLNIGMVYVTLSPLTWDPADWAWKFGQDTGLMYEQLFAADLNKSIRKGGKHAFVADSWLPSDAIRGELAESWKTMDNPFRVEIKLRKGVMFPGRRRGLQLYAIRQKSQKDTHLLRSCR